MFLTSDTHFFHKRIINYTNRPFKNVEEMNEALIKNWNDTVKHDDIILHFGDFSFGNKDQVRYITQRLNGIKFLILGNHDRHSRGFYMSCGFQEVFKKPLILGNYVLSHRPEENLSFDIINIHGHTHNVLIDNPNYTNVCVENHDYKPVLFSDFKEYFLTKC